LAPHSAIQQPDKVYLISTVSGSELYKTTKLTSRLRKISSGVSSLNSNLKIVHPLCNTHNLLTSSAFSCKGIW